MHNDSTSQEVDLSFLGSEKGEEKIILSDGKEISIQKYFLTFSEWKGDPIPNTYGNKAVVNFNNEPLFAELAVLKLFKQNGWNGVWVDSYRRKYRVGLPDVVDPINLQQEHEDLLNPIRAKTGRSGGCWDLFLWKGDHFLFIELKRSKKDVIQASQVEWLDKARELGIKMEDFMFIEWKLI